MINLAVTDPIFFLVLHPGFSKTALMKFSTHLFTFIVLFAACVINTSSNAQDIPLTIDASASSLSVSVAGVSDSSAVSGASSINLTPPSEPFSTAQITTLDAIADDGFSLSVLGGLVSATADPGDINFLMTVPGPAGTVAPENTFDQLVNEAITTGTISVNDPFNLAGGSRTVDLSEGGPAQFDFIGVQLAVSGNQLSITTSFSISLPLDGGLTLDVDGLVVANGTLPVVETLTPESFSMVRGQFVSGTVTDLVASDNIDLSLRRNPIDVSPVTNTEFVATSTLNSVSGISVTLEGAVFARAGVNQAIRLFNFQTAEWETIDNRASTRFNDQIVTVDVTGDASRFVDANGELRARVIFRSVSVRQQFGVNIDQLQWTLTGN